MFCIVSYLVASTIATRIGLSLGLQGLQIIYVDQINDSSSSYADVRSTTQHNAICKIYLDVKSVAISRH